MLYDIADICFRNPSPLDIIYYTTSLRFCQEVFENFLKNFFGAVAFALPLPLTTIILYHKAVYLSSGFGKFLFVKIHKDLGQKRCRIVQFAQKRRQHDPKGAAQK